MALFGNKKTTEKKKEEKITTSSASSMRLVKKNKSIPLSSILRNPHITEKATESVARSNAYVFEVDPRANKKQVRDAIVEYYKVNPIKINLIKIPRKKVMVRGKEGFKKGGKKAVVYLKKGDKIEFV